MKIQSKSELLRLTIEKFQPLYGEPIDVEIAEEIVRNLAEFSAVVREINSNFLLRSRPEKNPVRNPVTLPRIGSLEAVPKPSALPQSGQPRVKTGLLNS